MASLSTGKPFSEELAAREKEREKERSVVNVGGGRGQALEQIRTDHSELAGRFVLLDLAPVIDDAVSAGLPSWMEPVAGSFFDPLPIHSRSRAVLCSLELS